jgi:hypothetical protein
MWGVGSGDPSGTIPSAFKDLLNREDVPVYNLGIIGARPLDEFLLVYLLQGDANLIVTDYNYEFGLPLDPAHLLQDPGASVRLSQLFANEGPDFIAAVPGIADCMEQAGLTPPREAPTIEAYLRSWMEHAIPVLRYKDRINDRLFGQHPLLLIQRVFLLASKALRDRDLSFTTIRSLFLPPEERIETVAWEPGGPMGSEAIQTQAFDPQNLHTCVSRAWSMYASERHLGVVTYLTPNNPGMFPGLHHSALHRNNIAVLEQAFSGTPFINLDDAVLQPSSFTDSTHLTPEGARAFAKILQQYLRPILRDAL